MGSATIRHARWREKVSNATHDRAGDRPVQPATCPPLQRIRCPGPGAHTGGTWIANTRSIGCTGLPATARGRDPTTRPATEATMIRKPSTEDRRRYEVLSQMLMERQAEIRNK